MKKIFTLIVASLFTTAIFAADHRPVIQLNNNKNYKVVIDGRSYFGDNITIRPDYFLRGLHSVRVYEMRRGFFGRTERLVDAAEFRIDRDDIMIHVDLFGNIRIREDNDHGWNKRNRRDHDDDGFRDNNSHSDRNSRRF